MSQIFLFSGENQFALREERKHWVKNFIEKHGEENLLTLDAKRVSLRDLLDEVAVAPFLGGNRLVVIEGTFKCSKDDAQRIKDVLHPQVILLFVVPLDSAKRGKLPASMKEVEKMADHKKFPLLTRPNLLTWIQQELDSLGASMTHDARDALLDIVGDDQGMLAQELLKLSLFSQGKEITKQHVLDLAVAAGEREVWRLMDLIGSGKVEEGIMYAKSLLERGDSPSGIWSRMLWMVTQLVSVWTVVQEGVTHPAAVVREAGVNFPTARSLLPLARKLDHAALSKIVDSVMQMDQDIKTGNYRVTAEAPEEICAVIDRCLLTFDS